MFPKAPNVQERHGINALAKAAAGMGAIWRETIVGDVGIDGQLEFVTEDGHATGRMIAVQVKSGTSYFQHGKATFWEYYAEKKHLTYWEHYPLPVLLVLHDEAKTKSYWVDVRYQIRSASPGGATPVFVPKANVLQHTTAYELFESTGAFSDEFIAEIPGVMRHMIITQSPNAAFRVSYLDLFSSGLTNIARSLYFGMDIAYSIADFDLEARNSEFGVGLGASEYEFLFGYTKFLLSQRLANIDFADFLIDWKENERMPSFLASLTIRGRLLVKAINAADIMLTTSGKLPDGDGLLVAQEGFVEMAMNSYIRRLPRIHSFQEIMRKEFAGAHSIL